MRPAVCLAWLALLLHLLSLCVALVSLHCSALLPHLLAPGWIVRLLSSNGRCHVTKCPGLWPSALILVGNATLVVSERVYV
jgi:hypothetical protein